MFLNQGEEEGRAMLRKHDPRQHTYSDNVLRNLYTKSLPEVFGRTFTLDKNSYHFPTFLSRGDGWLALAQQNFR